MHLLSFGPVSTSCSWTLTLLNDVTDIHFGVDPCGQICISSPCVNVSPFSVNKAPMNCVRLTCLHTWLAVGRCVPGTLLHWLSF